MKAPPPNLKRQLDLAAQLLAESELGLTPRPAELHVLLTEAVAAAAARCVAVSGERARAEGLPAAMMTGNFAIGLCAIAGRLVGTLQSPAQRAEALQLCAQHLLPAEPADNPERKLHS